MKIGIVGGTFDPIHNAHLFIAEEARVRFALDRVVFIPNALPPHKQTYAVSDPADRLAMVKLAVETNPRFEWSRIELDRPGPSYTADTLREMLRQNPDSELFFITGTDTVSEIPTWYRPDDVIRLTRFIAAERPGYERNAGGKSLPERLMERVVALVTPHLDISSTDIRRRVQEGLPIRYLTPDSVVDYIASNGLYKPPQDSRHPTINSQL